ALALVLARSRHAHEISLWLHDRELACQIACTRENARHLPGFKLAQQVRVVQDVASALERAAIVIGAMPSAHARGIYTAAAGHIAASALLVSATKGLEPNTQLRITEVMAQAAGIPLGGRVAVLSGPSFAQEVAEGRPTAVVVASQEAKVAARLQEGFAAPRFRLDAD